MIGARYRTTSEIRWVDVTYELPMMWHDNRLWGRAGSSIYVSDNHWRTRELVHSFDAGSTARNMMGIAPSTFIVGVDNQIMRTSDGGESFEAVLTATEEGSTFGLKPFTRQSDGTLYAATYGTKEPSNGEVFKSSDGGVEWKKILDLVANFDGVFQPDGTHIHGIHADPHNDDIWLVVGDRPNSAILRCEGSLSPDNPSNWEILSHATANPLAFEGYPNDIEHQPIDAWFDEDNVYLSNDNPPWAVKAFNKNTGEWFIPLDYTDYGMPNMNSGAYGMFMFADGGEWVYHGSRSNSPENPAHLWKMNKVTKEWVHVWKGMPAPASGYHGISNMFRAGNYFILYYHYGSSSPYIGKMKI